MIKNALYLENIKIAMTSIKSHKLRTILTISIIAFGIMALVGILTAIDSIKASITSSFSRVGSNTFTMRIQFGGGNRPVDYKTITFEEARNFKELFNFPTTSVSVSTFATFNATAKYKSEKTNPNIGIMGVDENYFTNSGYEIDKGRNFTAQEINYGTNFVVIGSQLAKTLFKNNENPINKDISLGGGKYTVIGVLKEKGSSLGFSGDKNSFISVQNVRQNFSRNDMSFTISVMTTDLNKLEAAIDEATGTFRIIRKLKINEADNFEIAKSDNMAKMMLENIKYVTIAATIIGLITLLGAAIALMNIMLVSVNERTREIGLRKSIGATKQTIRRQFLIEAIVICQLGGLFGILLGIIIGNLISLITGGSFIIPWFWIFGGFALSYFVGVASGYYPAVKAANLDPIEALRYE